MTTEDSPIASRPKRTHLQECVEDAFILLPELKEQFGGDIRFFKPGNTDGAQMLQCIFAYMKRQREIVADELALLDGRDEKNSEVLRIIYRRKLNNLTRVHGQLSRGVAAA